MSAPEVSVIITVFNGEKFLAEAIKSICQQTFSRWELIIVDDGSTDTSGSIARSWQDQDKRIRLLSLPHEGRGQALNAGIQEARGALVAILDADDVAWSERLEKQVAFLQKNGDVGLLGGGVRRINSAGKCFTTVIFSTEQAKIREELQYQNCFAHSTVMFRKVAWERVGGYRPLFAPAEDYDFILRLEAQFSLANLPEPLVDYRVHAGQISFENVEHHVLVTKAALYEHVRRAQGKPYPEELSLPVFKKILFEEMTQETWQTFVVGELRARAILLEMCEEREASLRLLEEGWRWAECVSASQRSKAIIASAQAARYFRGRHWRNGLSALGRVLRHNPVEIIALMQRFCWRRS